MSRVESPDARLVELLRRSDAPSEEDMRRIREAVALKIAVGVGASTTLLAATHTSWAARFGALGAWTKGTIVATSLVGAGVGLTWQVKQKLQEPSVAQLAVLPAVGQSTKRTQAQESKAAHQVPESREPDQPAAESEVPEHDPKARGTTAKSVTRATPSTLEAELEILGRAQRALTSGQPNEALRALEEHAKRFPSGVLALERSGVRTVALCQGGRIEEGRSAARSYLRSVPNSVLSKRIRVACKFSDE